MQPEKDWVFDMFFNRSVVLSKYLEPIQPLLFIKRAEILFIVLLFSQAAFIWIFSDFYISHFIVLLFVFLFGQLFFRLLIKRADSQSFNIQMSEPFFLIILTASFLAVIFFSRYDYVREYLIGGLVAARSSPNAGLGGWYSTLTIWFYPLCALAAVTGMRFSTYLYTLVLLLVVMGIDCYVLGTRNVPFFALIFHLFGFRGRIGKSVLMGGTLLVIVGLGAIINYQTMGRSWDTLNAGWSWVNTLRHTSVADNMPINESAINLVDNSVPFLQPMVFLLLYLSHSVGECAEVLSNTALNWLGAPNYLLDQLCVIFRCGREPFAEAIAAINSRSGFYQTLYVSLFYDYGFLGFLGVILFLGIVLYAGSLYLVLPLIFYLAVILSVSPIENYFYNGFGLGRSVSFILLWVFLVKTEKGSLPNNQGDSK